MAGKDLRRKLAKMIGSSKKEDRYLTFTAVQANSTVAIEAIGSASSVSLEYSVDGGNTWMSFVVGTTTVTLANDGDSVKMRGVNSTFCSNSSNYNHFLFTGRIESSGDLTSIINGIGGDCSLPSRCFIRAFRTNSALLKAPNLPSKVVPTNCYYEMFISCSNLAYIRTEMETLSSAAITIWCQGVASSGTFVCSKDITLSTGASGIPSGWTRINLDGTPYVDPNA